MARHPPGDRRVVTGPGGHQDRHIRVKLRSLAPGAVPAGACAPGPARPLCGRLRYRRAEQQLLPLAPARGVRQLAGPVAGGFPAVGQGAPRADPCPQAVRAGGLAAAHRGRAGMSWAISGRCCWSSCRPRCRGMMPGWRISSGWSRAGCGWRWSSGITAGIARRSLRCWKRTGRVLRDERGEPAVRAARHHRFRLRTDARPGSSSPVRRFLPRCRPEVVGRRIGEWNLADLEVYVYFNNDGNANAVRNARTLHALLGPDCVG